MTTRNPNKETLPGDHILYDIKPPRVDYYDVFYFETRVRDMIEDYMEPFNKAIKDDKKVSIKLRFDYDKIIERLHELESFALIQDWKLSPSQAWKDLKEQMI